MRVVRFLAELSRLGCWIERRGGRLIFHGKARLLSAERRAFLEENRPEIEAFLARSIAEMTPEELEAFDYRPSPKPFDESEFIEVANGKPRATESREPRRGFSAREGTSPPSIAPREQGALW